MSDSMETLTEAMNEEKTEKKGIKAKTVSLWAKIIALIIVVGGHALKWTGVLPGASSNEICACGFTVMGIFGTVDINILIDKFTSKE